MAHGAVRRAPADVAVSITGIAGPGGGSPQKPVGLVYLGVARRDGACRVERRVFPGNRGEIRQAVLIEALQMLEAEARAA
jgi:nicotinamide-nucleotide amidase